MKPARPMADYERFVKLEVLGASPGDRVRRWERTWLELFRVMAGQNAIFELTGLVVARWEFLGGLYNGTEGGTDFRSALAYSRRFLFRVNANYGAVEKLVDRADSADRFDLFTMLRDKPLHGVVPAGIATDCDQHVVTWWIGFAGTHHDAIQQGGEGSPTGDVERLSA